MFLKRHRIPKEHSTGDYFGVEDLNVGQTVTFYARTFFVVSCDPFTRTFLTNSGVDVGEEVGYPDDPIDLFRTSRKSVRVSTRRPSPSLRSSRRVRAVGAGLHHARRLTERRDSDGR